MTAASTSDARKRHTSPVDPVGVVDAAELMARLQRAVVNLDVLSEVANDPLEAKRIQGKSEGARLALSYVREMKRKATL